MRDWCRQTAEEFAQERGGIVQKVSHRPFGGLTSDRKLGLSFQKDRKDFLDLDLTDPHDRGALDRFVARRIKYPRWKQIIDSP